VRPGPAGGGKATNPVQHALSGYRFDACRFTDSRACTVAANWKLTVDVNFEGYHFPSVHSTSLHTFATGNASYDLYGTAATPP
jgi:carnitine monooxygenase subunit